MTAETTIPPSGASERALRRLRVMFVDTEMGRIVGGAQTYLLRLLPRLISGGHDIEVITEGRAEPSFAVQLRESGVRVRHDVWRSPSVPVDAARLLALYVNASNPDVFVVSVSSSVGWLALPQLRPSIGVVSIAHLDAATFYSPLRHYGGFVHRAGGVSPEIVRKLVEDVGIPEDRVWMLPYGVPVLSEAEALERLHARRYPGRLEVVYCGRLVETQKRISDLVELIKACREDPIGFRIVGDGPERTRMQKELSRQLPPDRIRFDGWLSWTGVRQALQESDVYVLMSDVEGLPIALLEAMGQAVVPVVTCHPATAFLVRAAENGLLTRVGDVQDSRSALLRLSADDEFRARLALRARDTAVQFSKEAMTTAYVNCFYSAAAQASREPPAVRGEFPVMPSCRSRYPLWLRRLKVEVSRLLLAIRSR